MATVAVPVAIVSAVVLADVLYGVGGFINVVVQVATITLSIGSGYLALRRQGKTRRKTVVALTHALPPVAFVDLAGDWQAWRKPVIGTEALRTGGPVRRWARTLKLPRAGWIEVLLIVAAVSLAGVFIEIHPRPDTLVVKPSLCSPSAGSPVESPPMGDCPFFAQQERGMPWVFTRSVKPAPPGADTEWVRWSPVRAGAPGLRPLSLAGDLLVVELFAVIIGAAFFIRVWFDHL